MQLPIIIDGEETGSLTVAARGAFTVLSARLRDPGRVVRLTVYGDGAFYLGVPEPAAAGELLLVRRFTPREMRAFPRAPVCAAEERPATAEPPAPRLAAARVLWFSGRPHYF